MRMIDLGMLPCNRTSYQSLRRTKWFSFSAFCFVCSALRSLNQAGLAEPRLAPTYGQLFLAMKRSGRNARQPSWCR